MSDTSISINYRALGRNLTTDGKGTAANEADESIFNVENGLSEKELLMIDTNSDGAISEEEYKAAFGGEGDAYLDSWNAYTSAYKAESSKADENGNYTVTTNKNGRVITSKYNADGTLVEYTSTKTDKNTGIKTATTYDAGENTEASNKTKVVTTYPDGYVVTEKYAKNNEGKNTVVSTTTKQPDGTKITTNNTGEITKITGSSWGAPSNQKVDAKTEYKNDTINFSTKDGKDIATIKFADGTEIKSTSTKESNGVISYLDENGNTIAKVKTNDDGTQRITTFKEGKKYNSYQLDNEGKLVATRFYDSNGNMCSKIDASTGRLTTYEYDEQGNRTSAITYRPDGTKYSEQKYAKDDPYREQRGYEALSERTYFDEDGKPTKTEKFSHEKTDNGGVTTRETYSYTEDGKIKKNPDETRVFTRDSYGNYLETKVYDGKIEADEKPTKTITTSYKEGVVGEKIATDEDKTQRVIKYDSGRNVTETWDNGVVTSKKDVSAIKNGKNTVTTYTYTYYEGTNIVKSCTRKQVKDNKTTTKTINFKSVDGTKYTTITGNDFK